MSLPKLGHLYQLDSDGERGSVITNVSSPVLVTDQNRRLWYFYNTTVVQAGVVGSDPYLTNDTFEFALQDMDFTNNPLDQPQHLSPTRAMIHVSCSYFDVFYLYDDMHV